jgi:ATP-binding cassette subfamily F protein 3
LDIPSQEILQTMLAQFKGTILLVSHDRFLIDALATQIWYIHRETTQMDLFRGTYSEYRVWQQTHETKLPATPPVNESTDNKPRLPEKPHKGTSNRERQRLARIAKLESGIAVAENELSEVTQAMIQAAGDVGKMLTLNERYLALEKTIADTMAEWEQLSGEE